MQVSLKSAELSLAIRAIDVTEMEFKNNIFEFMMVTPGGIVQLSEAWTEK